MAFLWRHGDYAARDCDDCQAWIHDGAAPYLDGDKNRVPLPAGTAPRCENAPCRSRDGKPRFEEWMLGVLRLWRNCRTYRALPAAGGVAGQDAYLMELFEALDVLRAEIDNEELERLKYEAGRK